MHGGVRGRRQKPPPTRSTKEKHNDAECLYICVSDNGKGFSAEVLEKIENNGEIYYNDRRHVGLQNIKKRLNLIYGEQAEFPKLRQYLRFYL